MDSTENRLRSQLTPTPYKIKINNCKLIDLVIRIELIRATLMPRLANFSEKFDHSFRMFLYLETCFLRVMASLICRLQDVAKIHFPIYSNLISEGRWNCDRETGTAMKPWLSGNMFPNIKTCEHLWSNFSKKITNRGIKIVRVNSIITKSINLQLFRWI